MRGRDKKIPYKDMLKYKKNPQTNLANHNFLEIIIIKKLNDKEHRV